ncbi:galactose oxidase-like domain-containing protein [Ascidiimonas sp. W6]|uniref:galactose oxidase-like domain-containing protein n=1 Tax=Ascidiimonas meishanensis TaxID=3128903 RepID=UPI0030EBB607
MRNYVIVFVSMFFLTGCNDTCENLGSWETTEDSMELVAVHAALLPNGKVLTFSYNDRNALEESEGKYQIWNPETRSPEGENTYIEGWNPFCSGHSFLGDGRLFIAGGHVHWPGESGAENVATINLDESGNPNWDIDFKAMGNNRWYPTVVTLANGNAQVIGGSSPILAYNWAGTNDDYEYYDLLNDRYVNKNITTIDYPEDGAFNYPSNDERQEVASGKKLAGLYPLTHLLPKPDDGSAPDGILFVLTESFLRLYNPTTNRIINTKIDVGGFRTWWTQGSSVLLPIPIDENGNPPDTVKVMVIGGGTKGTNDENVPALSDIKIFTYDVNAQTISETQKFESAGRLMGDGILLPDGNVLIVGGAKTGYANTNQDRFLKATLLKIVNGERVAGYRDLADAEEDRGYHASALLLPDASVMVSGGNGNWLGMDGPEEELTSVEVFSPPYIDNPLLTRPIIFDAPETLQLDQEFSVTVNDPDVASRIVLVRHGSRTHSLDTDQRLLNFTAVKTTLSDGRIRLTARMPDDASYIPPGPYMIFVLKEIVEDSEDICPQDFIPSKAKHVLVSNYLEKTNEMVEEISVRITTGEDDLRGDNRAFIEIYDRNDDLLGEIKLNDGGESFANGSINTFNYTFDSSISLRNFAYIKVRHTSGIDNVVLDPDNWSINQITARLRSGINWRTQIDLSGEPVIRLSETFKDWKVSF